MAWYDTPTGRTIRRFGIVFVFGGLSALISFLINLPPEQMTWFVPILTSILTALDKALREDWGA
jgi:hypothetical protein